MTEYKKEKDKDNRPDRRQELFFRIDRGLLDKILATKTEYEVAQFIEKALTDWSENKTIVPFETEKYIKDLEDKIAELEKWEEW